MQVHSKTFQFGSLKLSKDLIFFEKEYLFAFIPLVEIQPGRKNNFQKIIQFIDVIIIPKRAMKHYKDCQNGEVMDVALTLKLFTKYLPKFLALKQGSTVYFHNYHIDDSEELIKNFHIHVIPRKEGDLENDQIYEILDSYDKEQFFIPITHQFSFKTKYNSVIVSKNNYSQKILEGLKQKADKFQQYFTDLIPIEKQSALQNKLYKV